MAILSAQAHQISMLIAHKAPVHMMGICGIGMAGVARLLDLRSVPVSGCDSASGRIGDWLQGLGIPVANGHAECHIEADTGWIIYSPAVPADAPELIAARARGLPCFRRGEVLPVLLAGRLGIAVCGTHGKTTTASMIAQLLAAAGGAPAWCIGGQIPGMDGVAGDGGGAALVVEADESDGTLALYHPDITVLTNVDFDHMEHFESESDFDACFQTVLTQTNRCIIVCADDRRACSLMPESRRCVSYGCAPEADYRIENVCSTPPGMADRSVATEFSLFCADRMLGRVALPVAGHHNMLNATGALVAFMEAGGDFADGVKALANVQLPRRRFEIAAAAQGITVISDYAHHPTEIAALVRMARETHAGRIRAVFQPHRYTRTRALLDRFAPAFDGIDELILVPVYPASESPLPGGQIWDLYEALRQYRAANGHVRDGGDVMLASSRDQVWQYYAQTLTAGDMALVIGAGDVVTIAETARGAAADGSLGHPRYGQLPEGLLSCGSRAVSAFDLGRRTTFGLGGTADLWVDVVDEKDLIALQQWCRRSGTPLHLHAAGSNVIASDLGVRGVVAALNVVQFGGIEERDGELVVGPACPLAKLLSWCEAHGRRGLERLQGIPGTVGGAMRMNAGAWGMTFGEHVSWIRSLKDDGSIAIVPSSGLGLGYRRCDAVADSLVLEVALRLDVGESAAIGAERRTIAERRAWQRGLRSAGSVFRNPAGHYAAQLIESVGLKGYTVGGAVILEHHANMIVAQPGAVASDVIALAWRMQDTVSRETGVELKREMIILE